MGADHYALVLEPGWIHFGHRTQWGWVGQGEQQINWVAGNDYSIRLEMRNSAKKVYVNGVLQFTSTENTNTSRGSVSVSIDDADATSGFQLDSISGVNIGSLPDPPVVTGLSSTSGSVGSAFSASIQATNNPQGFALASGSLPPGLFLNFSSGLISGIPTAVGTSSFTVTATNGVASAAVPFTITVGSGLPVTGEFLKDTFTGTSGTVLPSHTGEMGATWSVDSSNHPGGTIENNRAAGWVIGHGGTDVVASAVPASEEYDVTMVVHVKTVRGRLWLWTRRVGSDRYYLALQPHQIAFGHRYPEGWVTLAEAPITWVPGTDYTIRLEMRNAAKKVYVNGGLLLTITENNNANPGSISILIDDGDATNGFQLDSISGIIVGSPPAAPIVTGLSSTSGTVGSAFTANIQATNNPQSFALASGSLPAGLSLNTTTGVIGGTPTSAGSSSFAVSATNAGGTGAAVSFTISVSAAPPAVPVVTGLSANSGTVGSAFTANIQATNNPQSFGLASGSLPAGLSLNTTTGAISGTPASAGSSSFAVSATNAGGTSAAVSFTITIASGAPPSPALTTLVATANGFVVSWNAVAGATLYDVRRNSTSVGTTTDTSLTVSGLSAGSTYSITVSARNASGIWSEWSPALVIDGVDSGNQIHLRVHQPSL